MQTRPTNKGEIMKQSRCATLFILAGGRATRMGGADKAWIEFEGRSFFERMIENLSSAAQNILVSANRNEERYAPYPVIRDEYPEYVGPLAGIDALSRRDECQEWAFIVPCDTPWLERDVLELLWKAHEEDPGADAFVPRHGGRMQSAVVLANKKALRAAAQNLAAGERRLGFWLKCCGARVVEMDGLVAEESFFNINSLQELDEKAQAVEKINERRMKMKNLVRVPLEKVYRLFGLGGVTLVSAEHEGSEDVMAAAWVSPLNIDPARVTVCIDSEHYTRKLVDASRMFGLSLPMAGLADVVIKLGGASKNDDDQKLERSGAKFFKLDGYEMPFVEGCACYVVFRAPVEERMEKEYDLFVGEAVEAWADPRIFDGSHWLFEKTSEEMSTLHYVSGGCFYGIGRRIDV